MSAAPESIVKNQSQNPQPAPAVGTAPAAPAATDRSGSPPGSSRSTGSGSDGWETVTHADARHSPEQSKTSNPEPAGQPVGQPLGTTTAMSQPPKAKNPPSDPPSPTLTGNGAATATAAPAAAAKVVGAKKTKPTGTTETHSSSDDDGDTAGTGSKPPSSGTSGTSGSDSDVDRDPRSVAVDASANAASLNELTASVVIPERPAGSHVNAGAGLGAGSAAVGGAGAVPAGLNVPRLAIPKHGSAVPSVINSARDPQAPSPDHEPGAAGSSPEGGADARRHASLVPAQDLSPDAARRNQTLESASHGGSKSDEELRSLRAVVGTLTEQVQRQAMAMVQQNREREKLCEEVAQLRAEITRQNDLIASLQAQIAGLQAQSVQSDANQRQVMDAVSRIESALKSAQAKHRADQQAAQPGVNPFDPVSGVPGIEIKVLADRPSVASLQDISQRLLAIEQGFNAHSQSIAQSMNEMRMSTQQVVLQHGRDGYSRGHLDGQAAIIRQQNYLR